MLVSRILKWVTGSFEAILGISLLGGALVIGAYYTPLFIMLTLHIVTLIFTKKDNGASVGNTLGIITSCIVWVPFVGMIMHILSAVFIMIDASKPDKVIQTISMVGVTK